MQHDEPCSSIIVTVIIRSVPCTSAVSSFRAATIFFSICLFHLSFCSCCSHPHNHFEFPHVELLQCCRSCGGESRFVQHATKLTVVIFGFIFIKSIKRNTRDSRFETVVDYRLQSIGMSDRNYGNPRSRCD